MVFSLPFHGQIQVRNQLNVAVGTMDFQTEGTGGPDGNFCGDEFSPVQVGFEKREVGMSHKMEESRRKGGCSIFGPIR